MTLSELEKFYQLGNIEGLAFVNSDGLLIEDQMVLSSAAAQAVASGFSQVHRGLDAAGRICRGFLVKFQEHQFVSVSLPGGILILQLNPSQPVNQFYEQAIAMALHNEGRPAPVADKSESPATDTGMGSLPAESSPDLTADEGLMLTISDFEKQLTRALTRVAPSSLVPNLLERAKLAVGLIEGGIPELGHLRSIGIAAVNLVPNKGRRKMVAKELEIILQNMGL